MATPASTLSVNVLASGTGWRVQDVSCTAGPHDRPFEERHATVSLGAVLGGTFCYRTTQGSALLAPGAVLLGNFGQCYECSHPHSAGDRCVSVHFAPDYWEDLLACIPGVRRAAFRWPHLPPSAGSSRALAGLGAARKLGGPALEEAALELAASVVQAAGQLPAEFRRATARDERRIAAAVRLIESTAHDLESDRLRVGQLARDANLTPYHFLRTFRRVVGMTPHQYVIRTRLQRAAVRLCVSAEPVSRIAYACGFNDLSTFNHQFRRALGESPSAYRVLRRRQFESPTTATRRLGSSL